MTNSLRRLSFVRSRPTLGLMQKHWTHSSNGNNRIQNNRNSFYCHDLIYEFIEVENKKPNDLQLGFGRHFSDHMFDVTWTLEKGWAKPRICPIHNIVLHSAAKVYHYGQALFEGMKAYHGPDGEIRLFRPDLNLERMVTSAVSLGLPSFDPNELRECIIRLIDVDRKWVPKSPSTSLYIRPTFMGTEPTLGLATSNQALLYVITSPVGLYYGTDAAKPVSLFADSNFVRAWPGGSGDKKVASNYAPTLNVQKEATSFGMDQVLWLFGPDQRLTEVGAMNVFVLIRNKDGEMELITPPLTGLILPGITRRSVLELAREWNDFKVSEREITMNDLREMVKEDRVVEMFGTGTAAIVTPIDRILHRQNNDKEMLMIPTMESEVRFYARILKTLMDIQHGVVEHPWSLVVKRYQKR